MTVTRPALRYMGGKWRAGSWILEHFPAHRVYVEPFGGGASVLLQKPRAKFEVYNDVDGDVVNLFRVLRDKGDRLRQLLRLTPYSREEFKLSHRPVKDPLERARRLVVRSFMSVGGMRTYVRADGRISHSGFENSTWKNRNNPASRSWADMPLILEAVVARLQGVAIEHLTAEHVISEHDHPDSLIYCDPPYPSESRADPRRSKYRHGFTTLDHEQLAGQLNAVQGAVVISGYRCDLYDRLYRGWERRDFNAMAFGQKPKVESIWLRNIRHDLFSP